MDLTTAFYVTTICAILLTGVSKSGFGGGLGVISVPLISLSVSPVVAVAVLMPILLIMDILIVARYRNEWDAQVLLQLLPGAVIGLTLGATVFELMDAALVRLLVGLLALFFVVQYLVGGRAHHGASRDHWIGGVLGAVSGFASYVAHAGGPPVKGFLLRKDLGKTRFVGTNTMFFFTMNMIKTVAYGAFGSMTSETLWVSLWVSPFLFVGVFIGLKLHRLVDQARFTQIVYAFLSLTAVKLIWDSIAYYLL